MLVLGKRQPSLAKLINGWLVGWSQMMFYNNLATDERPPLFPEF
jgi:hypothetical protein